MLHNNKYLNQIRNRTIRYLRLRLGIFQLARKPLLNILLIPVIILFAILYKLKEKVMFLLDVPQLLFPVFSFSVSFITVIIPILFLLLLIDYIGLFTARKDECALMIAFEPKELRNGCPILMSKKKLKGTNVIRREYYSDIPLHILEKRKNEIADAMNSRFVDEIQYGGRANGKRIVIYTTSGRKAESKRKLYDEEF